MHGGCGCRWAVELDDGGAACRHLCSHSSAVWLCAWRHRPRIWEPGQQNRSCHKWSRHTDWIVAAFAPQPNVVGWIQQDSESKAGPPSCVDCDRVAVCGKGVSTAWHRLSCVVVTAVHHIAIAFTASVSMQQHTEHGLMNLCFEG